MLRQTSFAVPAVTSARTRGIGGDLIQSAAAVLRCGMSIDGKAFPHSVNGKPITPRMLRLLHHAATENAQVPPIDRSVALVLERHRLVVLDAEELISLTDAGRDALRAFSIPRRSGD
jgi:hypothetical protein